MFTPEVNTWFAGRFGAPTEAQRLGWPAIAAGDDVLIAAPTGSGKTLAAFLWCIDDLLTRAKAGTLEDRTYVVYVSPLKALSSDIRHNLAGPLAELAAGSETAPQAIRIGVRTGDTPMAERQRLAKHPPHILVTTPESLYILLTTIKGQRALSGVRTVIVDEIHAIVDDRRGAHLSLTLARLDALHVDSGNIGDSRHQGRAQRIGLSATQTPIALVGRFLTGGGPCTIVDTGHTRALDLGVLGADGETGTVLSNEQWESLYDQIADLARTHRSTIVFTNTRRLAERVAHRLSQRLGEGLVMPHHGALARAVRQSAEERLRLGELKVVVATASLELGIDVGAVELVVQLGSPRNIATFLQRVGRANHSLHGTPKGRIFALSRDDLVECAALIRAIRARRLDALSVPEAPLDVLAQQLVAMCAAATDGLAVTRMLAIVNAAMPYRDLTREALTPVLEMLAEGIATRKGRSGAHLHWDRVGDVVRARRGARMAAILSGGAIPDRADYEVVVDPEGVRVGTVDEDFAIDSRGGDIFLLGNMSWRIRRVELGKVRVEDARGMPPTIPFWFGEAPLRTRELSDEVSRLREDVLAVVDAARIPPAHPAANVDTVNITDWLAAESGLAPGLAQQLVDYLVAARAALGVMPTRHTIVAERFFDEGGGMQLVLHAPLGSGINRAWGMALRKRFCRSFDFELQAAATEDGILLSLGAQHSFPLETVAAFVPSHLARETLVQAALQAPVFEMRWRWNAARALAVLRHNGAKKVPPHIQRMRAADLLAAVFPAQVGCQDNHGGGPIEAPDHPLVNQTLRDCLEEAMDTPGLEGILRELESGAITFVTRETPEPSPLAHAILNAMPYAFLDDAPLEERRARAVSMRRGLPADVAGELGRLDPKAIATVRDEARPRVRDAEELHDLLCLVTALPEGLAEPSWRPWLTALITAKRAVVLAVASDVDSGNIWVAAERLPLAHAAYPGAVQAPADTAPAPGAKTGEPHEAIRAIVRGRLETAGPTTEARLATDLRIKEGDIAFACAELEADGAILRGQFEHVGPAAPQEWCDRRLLARIQRLTLGRLRQDIQPVPMAVFQRFLTRWQHTAPATQLFGATGLLTIIEQLEGHEAPIGAWEREIFPARVADYSPALLDELCLSGEIMWGRRSASSAEITTRATPIAFWRRTSAASMLPLSTSPADRDPETDTALDDGARAVEAALRARGALFYAELLAATNLTREALDDALWRLVATGRVTSDGFAALRTLAGEQGTRRSGRWALLAAPDGHVTAHERLVDFHARALLGRYGVVFRELVAREILPPWRDLLVYLRRMEARGELRGGRFVDGFVGEQFALPMAVETLRARAQMADEKAVTTPLGLLSARDPLQIRCLLPAAPLTFS